MKLYEIGIVHIITKALKMHINNRYNTWEARQLFFLTSSLEKKNEVTCKIPPRTCLHSTGQVVPDPVWLWAGRVVSIPKPAQLGAADALQGFSRRGVTPCRGDSSSSSASCSWGLIAACPHLQWEPSWPKAEAGSVPNLVWAWGAPGSTACAGICGGIE